MWLQMRFQMLADNMANGPGLLAAFTTAHKDS